jgi:hypothetical protein
MATTGAAKYPYPNSSAIPDVPADILLLDQRLLKMNGSGIARVANSTERAALVTNGDAFDGLFCLQVDTMIQYVYDSGVNPAGTGVAGWYPVAGELPILIVTDTASQTVSTLAVITAWGTEEHRRTLPVLASGVFTVPSGLNGRYSICAAVQTAAGSGVGSYLELRKGASAIVSASDGNSSANGAFLSVACEIVLAAGDTISVAAQRTAISRSTIRLRTLRWTSVGATATRCSRPLVAQWRCSRMTRSMGCRFASITATGARAGIGTCRKL